MEKMIELMRAKSEQFTSVELQAEILRQQIQELEKEDGHDHEIPESQRATHLKALKHELAYLQQPAELNHQGRVLMSKYWKMMSDMQRSESLPSDADKVLQEFSQWVEAMENRRNQEYRFQIQHFNRHWPHASWTTRKQDLGWIGKSTLRRYAFDKPRYYVGRALVGWLWRAIKK